MRTLLLSVSAVSLFAGTAIAQTTAPAATEQSPSAATAPTTPPAVQCVGATGVVYFDLGSTSLNADSETSLRDIANARRAECATQITLTGHTDSTGSAARNRQIATQRAAAVQAQLVTLGVPSEEIAVGVAGENVPQGAEDRLNRRVTITLTASPRTPAAAPAAPPATN